MINEAKLNTLKSAEFYTMAYLTSTPLKVLGDPNCVDHIGGFDKVGNQVPRNRNVLKSETKGKKRGSGASLGHN